MTGPLANHSLFYNGQKELKKEIKVMD